MAEKRFKLIEESDWWGITDNQLPKTEYGFREDLPNGYLSCDYKYNDLTPQEVVDLLNTLHEENQQLKNNLSEIEKIINNRLDPKVVPKFSDGKTELFMEEKVGYFYALEQLKKKLIREDLLFKNEKED